MCKLWKQVKNNISFRHQLSGQDDPNCTPEHVAEDSNSHFKRTTLSKRQVIYILLAPIFGATTIVTANLSYRGGFISKTLSDCCIVGGVALIILGPLLTIIYIIYKRNKFLRRSLDIEKVRLFSTIIEQDRLKNNNNENVERDPDATTLPDYKPDSHCGLLVDKPTSLLRENEATQEHKTSVNTD
ncbi:uncharacterized protein LOC112568062 [Pomacea canaliculata]|uniref:uncharacterized protein LOC112568062 n=1 Tax=Pomacea canaliculata TaxID=400727 RepID=UPI000D738C73|nr:uncharacterized protein LOC112568062 [Pomacea canaliculata]